MPHRTKLTGASNRGRGTILGPRADQLNQSLGSRVAVETGPDPETRESVVGRKKQRDGSRSHVCCPTGGEKRQMARIAGVWRNPS